MRSAATRAYVLDAAVGKRSVSWPKISSSSPGPADPDLAPDAPCAGRPGRSIGARQGDDDYRQAAENAESGEQVGVQRPVADHDDDGDDQSGDAEEDQVEVAPGEGHVTGRVQAASQVIGPTTPSTGSSPFSAWNWAQTAAEAIP